MKKFVFAILVAVGLVLGAQTAEAQDPPVAATPAAMTVSATALSTTAPAPPTMSAPATTPAPAKSPINTPIFWITMGSMILGIVIYILKSFGVLNSPKIKAVLESERAKSIQKAADKAIDGFKSYAATTPAKWDDIVAMVLKSLSVRFGELTTEEAAQVTAQVETRKAELPVAPETPEPAADSE